jgi:hypothetical protein
MSYCPPRFTPGLAGFDGADFAEGALHGYRWWTLAAPPLSKYPSEAQWQPGLLRGIKDAWQPGLNTARCLAGGGAAHDSSLVPHPECGCGFWAYWEIQYHDMNLGSSFLPVAGVVRGSGQVLMGPRGFRAQKAKIVGLYLPFQLGTRVTSQGDYRRTRFTGRVINVGTDYVPAPFRSYPPPTEAETAEAADRAEAWMGEIQDRLMMMYPDAEVFATLDLMTAKFPQKSEYVPPSRACEFCGRDYTDLHDHIPVCTENLKR